MDIGSVLEQAGGAGAIARQLGVDEATVERGSAALFPHVKAGVDSEGLPSALTDDDASDGGGIGGMLGGLLGGGGGLGGGGAILGTIINSGLGNQILGQIFGSKDVSRDVANQASEKTGIDPAILKQLLPIIAGAIAVRQVSHKRKRGGPDPSGGGVGGILGSLLGD